jgi:hypothetical protein
MMLTPSRPGPLWVARPGLAAAAAVAAAHAPASGSESAGFTSLSHRNRRSSSETAVLVVTARPVL